VSIISRVHSFILQGIDAVSCEIEVDLSPAELPRTQVVGLPDTVVRESRQRVRTAMHNSGYPYPARRILVNLAPADVPKEGPVYDLPIAVALLRAAGVIEASNRGNPDPEEYLIAGELALDGRVRPIHGAISLALLARQRGGRGVIVPAANAREAAAVGDVEVIGVSTLAEVVGLFNGTSPIAPEPAVEVESMILDSPPPIDFEDIRGQEGPKRALMVAAAGGHNLLLIGPPGTGKSLIAKALGGILPPLSREEALEVTRIYSSVGRIPPGQSLVVHRPVRAPHHTASVAAIVGGGSIPRPGDVSLAHRGVLFLDEIPEFGRSVLETLRQPLEDGTVTIARRHGSVRFPARFMLVAALNPTAKGRAATDEVSQREMERYLARLSRPLVDRIDLHVEVPEVPFGLLVSERRGTSTATIRAAVLRARAVQRQRQGGLTNAELSGRQLDRLVSLEEPARTLLGQAMRELHLSARAYDKIRRMARTIADLEEAATVAPHHVAEAVQYRLLDRRV
jgi:magnesium chelatase family protein